MNNIYKKQIGNAFFDTFIAKQCVTERRFFDTFIAKQCVIVLSRGSVVLTNLRGYMASVRGFEKKKGTLSKIENQVNSMVRRKNYEP